MEPEALCIYIGPTALGSDIAAAADSVELTVSETTDAGIQAADAADVCCVVTDHDPPAVDCFELLSSVEVPVVVAPTDGSSRLATRALAAGAETYLDPTTLEAGAAAIASTIDRLSVEQTRTQTADDRIEEFSSIVSHELRNPIQKASSGIALAKTQCESEYLDEVEATLSRMDELVENLLDQLDESDTSVELEAVELGQAVSTAWPAAPNATLSVEGDLPLIRADPSRLYQLLENLFRNCVDHGGESVTVRVGPLDAPNGHTGFYVADNGPGIESAHRGDVFEFGYTSSDDGTGLGLAIVDEIATTFGWTVTITDSESGGARFEISQIDII